MKTSKIQSGVGGFPPIVRFVQVVWYQAYKAEADEIALHFENDAFRIVLNTNEMTPPPPNLFEPVVKQFLDYTGTKIWPWTKRIKDKQCCVHVDDNQKEWSMHSDDLSKSLIIKKI